MTGRLRCMALNRFFSGSKLKLAIIVCSLTVLAGVGLWGCATTDPAVEPPVDLDPLEADPAVVGQHYPLQYASYLKNETMQRTRFGGSEPYDYLEKYPALLDIYEGIGFSIEYRRSRGHVYSLEDTLNTGRGKPGGACLTCKSGDVPRLLEEYGERFYAADFQTLAAESQFPVSCVDCHNPSTMELRISRPPLIKALERQGQNLDELTRDDFRSLVCAQCHVEYYFEPETLEVTFPWDEGLDIDSMEKYFADRQFTDWYHPTARVDLVKIQHPEYELYQGSVHDRLGLACADCHMPVMEAEGERYPSHWWTSPVHHLGESCGRCHGANTEALKTRMETVQEEIYEMQNEVAWLLVDAIKALEAAAENNREEAVLEEARAAYQKAHIRWDWIFVENSTGYHNSQAARESLTAAREYARQVLEILQAE